MSVARLFARHRPWRGRPRRQFAGGQESLSAGASAGTTGLFGGRNNEIALESIAFAQKNSGLNFADGVAEMTLRPTP